MESRAFGASGPRVAVIGQGTWKMEHDARAACVAALRRGLELGMTHVDTAELYGSGDVEELVGEAIAGRRDEIFLVSKVLPQHASYAGTLRACEQSLRRLRTEAIDCYLLHWVGREPLSETLRAFEDLRRAGKIRSYGVSNFDEDELAEAVRLAGPGKIAQNQVLYHLEDRSIERAVIPYCEAHGIAVVGYTPFGERGFPGRSKALTEIAAAHGATTRQVALAFLVRRPSLFAIPKASKIAHVEDNAGAARIALTEDEIARIDAEFPPGKRRR